MAGGGILYDTGSSIFELIQDSNAGTYDQASRIAIAVKDVKKLFEKLKGEIKMEFPLRDNSWGDMSFRIIDPDGFPITIFSPQTTQ